MCPLATNGGSTIKWLFLKFIGVLFFSVHLGVNKIYQRILNHFYWPKIRKEVAVFGKTCYICQMVGKPNKTNSIGITETNISLC